MQNRRARRSSGGILIYIKDSIRKGIQLVKNAIDCIVWLKFDKNYFKIAEDIYVAVTYVAPENSPVHNLYEPDIFSIIQDDITFFQTKGDVFLLGDLNSRTSIKADYIEYDRVIDTQDSEFDVDTPLPRSSMDRGTNRFGDLLLDLCKSVNLRIVNGRLHKDQSVGRVTCYTHNGESLVDYVLTERSNFDMISDFQVSEFNEYSNHAPISVSLKTNTIADIETVKERIYYKWNEENKLPFLHDLSRDSPILNRQLSDGIDSNCDPDDIVTTFTQFIVDRANPYFEKRFIPRKNRAFFNANTKEKQNWYNEECRKKHTIYKEALYNFNLSRNASTRKIMLDAKKDYRYYCRSCKSRYHYEQSRKMNEMRKKRPREFWKAFKYRKNIEVGKEISIDDFYEYFRSLAQEDVPFRNAEVDDFLHQFNITQMRSSTYCELDVPITQEEIKYALKCLKPNKACSLDAVLNEYLKESVSVLLKPLELLFNYILDKKSFPKQWTKGVIIPVFKKGDTMDPSNFRGITLVSCFGKLFTHIVNERLKRWGSQHEIISDAQFGFKAEFGTVDAIYILESLISKSLRENKKLYCAFVDYKRAFDSVYRNGLWFKIISSGIDGKLLDVIRSIYLEAKSCVKHLNTLSEFFRSDVGLLQGEVLSPILFSLFINDLESYLQQNPDACITLEQLSIYLLLFADDAVIFSDSIQGLQASLNNLESYCDKWNLQVNVAKTKIVVFRKGGILGKYEKWTYKGEDIEIVNSFNYLGIVLSSGGAFIKATNTLSGKALKAMNSLLSITKGMHLPIDIMLNLFDSFILSILNYNCEIWGFSRAENMERVHRKFCKRLLNVKISTNNLSLAGELGRFPLFIGRQIRIVKYWLRLHGTKSDNCILRTLNNLHRYETESRPNITSWTSKIKELLERSGFPDIWYFPESVDIKKFLPILRNRLRDIYINEWRQSMNMASSLYLYREMKLSFEMAPYLLKIKNIKYRNAIAKIRLSSHQLYIESGRHRNIERNDRKCILCKSNDLEDEYHFTLVCQVFDDLRKEYLKPYYYVKPSMYKFINLLNSSNHKTLYKLSLYIIKAFKVRNNILNVMV